MAGLIYYTDKRRVIPKLERTGTYLETINVTNPLIKKTKSNRFEPEFIINDEDLFSKIEEWKKTKSHSLAGEIISQALLTNMSNEIAEIKKHLISSSPNDQVLNFLFGDKKVIHSINDQIEYNHKKLKIEPNDSLTWTDQAINHLEKSNRDDAIKCIERALSINKDVGFIVRNASRIFSLTGDNGRAIKVLKNSEYYEYDPQILSAEISFSEIEERRTKGIDLGHKLIKKETYKNNEKTELASTLGTIEHFKGDHKKSDTLFELSLREPNANSIEQSMWYKKDFNTIKKFNDFKTNEILTHQHSIKQEYSKALEFALKWRDDEPYSTRPYKLASQLSGVLLGDYSKASEYTINGINSQKEIKGDSYSEKENLSNSNDIAYYLLKANKVEEAEEYISPFFNVISKATKYESHEAALVATFGLLAYKHGNNELGKSLYKKTIKSFTEIKEFYCLSSAFLNYFDEEINFINDLDSLSSLKKELEDVVNDSSQDDLKFRKNNSLKLLGERVVKIKETKI